MNYQLWLIPIKNILILYRIKAGDIRLPRYWLHVGFKEDKHLKKFISYVQLIFKIFEKIKVFVTNQWVKVDHLGLIKADMNDFPILFKANANL